MNMHGNRVIVSMYIVVGQVIFGSSVVAVNVGKIETVPDVDARIAVARRLLGERETMERDLVDILSNEKWPAKQRLQAAHALGRLRSFPAVPVLIRLIDLKDPEGLISEASVGALYPCAAALAHFGLAAVPQVVDAYLQENSEVRVRLFVIAIRMGGIRDKAAVYVRGLAAEKRHDARTAKVETLLKELLRE